MVEKLQTGDTLIVTEMSCLGRSTGEVRGLITKLVEFGVRIVILKQNMGVSAETQDRSSKVLITVFALLADWFGVENKQDAAAAHYTSALFSC